MDQERVVNEEGGPRGEEDCLFLEESEAAFLSKPSAGLRSPYLRVVRLTGASITVGKPPDERARATIVAEDMERRVCAVMLLKLLLQEHRQGSVKISELGSFPGLDMSSLVVPVGNPKQQLNYPHMVMDYNVVPFCVEEDPDGAGVPPGTFRLGILGEFRNMITAILRVVSEVRMRLPAHDFGSSLTQEVFKREEGGWDLDFLAEEPIFASQQSLPRVAQVITPACGAIVQFVGSVLHIAGPQVERDRAKVVMEMLRCSACTPAERLRGIATGLPRSVAWIWRDALPLSSSLRPLCTVAKVPQAVQARFAASEALAVVEREQGILIFMVREGERPPRAAQETRPVLRRSPIFGSPASIEAPAASTSRWPAGSAVEVLYKKVWHAGEVVEAPKDGWVKVLVGGKDYYVKTGEIRAKRPSNPSANKNSEDHELDEDDAWGSWGAQGQGEGAAQDRAVGGAEEPPDGGEQPASDGGEAAGGEGEGEAAPQEDPMEVEAEAEGGEKGSPAAPPDEVGDKEPSADGHGADASSSGSPLEPETADTVQYLLVGHDEWRRGCARLRMMKLVDEVSPGHYEEELTQLYLRPDPGPGLDTEVLVVEEAVAPQYARAARRAARVACCGVEVLGCAVVLYGDGRARARARTALEFGRAQQGDLMRRVYITAEELESSDTVSVQEFTKEEAPRVRAEHLIALEAETETMLVWRSPPQTSGADVEVLQAGRWLPGFKFTGADVEGTEVFATCKAKVLRAADDSELEVPMCAVRAPGSLAGQSGSDICVFGNDPKRRALALSWLRDIAREDRAHASLCANALAAAGAVRSAMVGSAFAAAARPVRPRPLFVAGAVGRPMWAPQMLPTLAGQPRGPFRPRGPPFARPPLAPQFLRAAFQAIRSPRGPNVDMAAMLAQAFGVQQQQLQPKAPCLNFQRTGKCNFGAACRFEHNQAAEPAPAETSASHDDGSGSQDEQPWSADGKSSWDTNDWKSKWSSWDSKSGDASDSWREQTSWSSNAEKDQEWSEREQEEAAAQDQPPASQEAAGDSPRTESAVKRLRFTPPEFAKPMSTAAPSAMPPPVAAVAAPAPVAHVAAAPLTSQAHDLPMPAAPMARPPAPLHMVADSLGWRRMASRSNPGVFYYFHEASGATQLDPPSPWERRQSRSQPDVCYYWNPHTGQTSTEKPEV